MFLLPLVYFLYCNIVCQIYAQQNKLCQNCKYFIHYKNNKNNKIIDFGLCKMFGSKVGDKKDEKIIYNFAQHCRDDENLCGKNSTFYEECGIINLESNKNDTSDTNDTIYKNSENIFSMLDDEMKKIINDYHLFLKNNNDW